MLGWAGELSTRGLRCLVAFDAANGIAVVLLLETSMAGES